MVIESTSIEFTFIKVVAVVVMVVSILYPVSMVVIGGYLRERKEKRRVKWPKK